MNVIGVSCPGFTKVPFEEMYESISQTFTHWEIFSELSHYLPRVSKDNYDLIKSSSMTFSLHTGIADINVASTNELVREASVSNIVSELRAANCLGIDTATVHPGVINMAVKGTRDVSIVQAQKSMKDIEKAANEYGVRTCIENMPNFPVMLGISADELFEIVDGTDLSICFDIGHANTFDQIDRMVELFKGRIGNIHIHDNMGKSDDHMTISEGIIDFRHVLSLLKGYQHRYIIESKTLESAIISQPRLIDLLKNQ